MNETTNNNTQMGSSKSSKMYTGTDDTTGVTIADPPRYKKMLERDAELLLRMSGQKALPAHIVEFFGREMIQADRALRTTASLRSFLAEPALGWVYAAVSANNVNTDLFLQRFNTRMHLTHTFYFFCGGRQTWRSLGHARKSDSRCTRTTDNGCSWSNRAYKNAGSWKSGCEHR